MGNYKIGLNFWIKIDVCVVFKVVKAKSVKCFRIKKRITDLKNQSSFFLKL